MGSQNNKPATVTDIDLSETVVDEDETGVVTTEIDSDIVDEDMDIAPEDRLPSRAIRQSDGSVILSFKYPRTMRTKKNSKIRKRHFKELHLFWLTGADRRIISSASEEMMVATAMARMARLNQAVANRLEELMDVADINAVGQVLANFSSTGLKTGKPG